MEENLIEAGKLICSGAPPEIVSRESSYFPYTSQFSTYCLRFPPSEDVFSDAPGLRYYLAGTLLQAYEVRAGGRRLPLGDCNAVVPQIRIDRRYRLVTGGQRVYSPASSAILSDGFWYQDESAQAPSHKPLKTYAVQAAWCHQDSFNVLYGDGAVRLARDEAGLIKSNSLAPGQTLADDGLYYATYAERVWGFFDDKRTGRR